MSATGRPANSSRRYAWICKVHKVKAQCSNLGQLANAAIRHCLQNHRRQESARSNARSARLAPRMYSAAGVRTVAASWCRGRAGRLTNWQIIRRRRRACTIRRVVPERRIADIPDRPVGVESERFDTTRSTVYVTEFGERRHVIASFGNRLAEGLFLDRESRETRRFPPGIRRHARRKLPFIVSMGPPDYPSAWLRPRRIIVAPPRPARPTTGCAVIQDLSGNGRQRRAVVACLYKWTQEEKR